MENRKLGKISYSRIIEIDLLLQKSMMPPLEDLAKRLNVSKRTIERDIEAMRIYFNSPLSYDRKSRTYHYADPAYRLPPIPLSQKELVSIVIAERALRQYSGTPFGQIAQSAFSKLLAMMPEESHLSVDPENLCKAIVYEQGAPIREYSTEIFSALLQGIIRAQRMEVVYYTPEGNREEGTRFVDPLHLANWGNEWFLIAIDLRKREQRKLLLSGIRGAHPIDLFFERPQGFSPVEAVSAEINKLEERHTEKLKVKIPPKASGWVNDKVWHYAQKFDKMEKDGSIVFYSDAPLDSPGKDSFLRWIMQFGDEVELLEPKWLRDEVRKRFLSACRKYGPQPE